MVNECRHIDSRKDLGKRPNRPKQYKKGAKAHFKETSNSQLGIVEDPMEFLFKQQFKFLTCIMNQRDEILEFDFLKRTSPSGQLKCTK